MYPCPGCGFRTFIGYLTGSVASRAGNQEADAMHKSQQPAEERQRIFEQNCSRCHTAPEGFSPRISGTIVRHMRVRASLAGTMRRSCSDSSTHK